MFLKSTTNRLLRYVLPYRGLLTLAVLSMIVYGITDGVVPLLIKRILDDIFGKQNPDMLYTLPAILMVFAIIRGLFGFLQHYIMATIGLAIVRDIRNEIHAHLLRLSSSFFDRNPSGGIVSRVTNDSLLVRQALMDSMTSLLRDTVRVIALLTTALYLDPLLGAVAFLGFPFGLIPVMRYGKKVRRLSRVGQDQFGGLTSALQESIAGNQVVQSFNLQQSAAERFEDENAKLTLVLKKAEKYGALSGPTNEIIASFAISAIVLYGGFSVMTGVRTQGDFIAFLTALFLLYEPLKKLGRANTTLQTGLSAAERIFEVLDTPSDIRDPVPALVTAPPYSIHFENVWFRYESNETEEQWALQNVNLDVREGETVALVGMSGGGKSTVAKLIPRLYDVQRGAVRIGGHDVRSLSLHSLRDAVSVVSQHTFLFNDTVAANIGFGRAGATSDDVRRAAEMANADVFIQRLPQGYDTPIGEQGLRLSGGERSRVSLARALLKDAPILLLDEATAALDSESEARVQEAIDRLMLNRTVIVIAHRLATIRKASRIAVIERGRIVEIGTHDELLATGGEYAKLYRIQFKTEAAEHVG